MKRGDKWLRVGPEIHAEFYPIVPGDVVEVIELADEGGAWCSVDVASMEGFTGMDNLPVAVLESGEGWVRIDATG